MILFFLLFSFYANSNPNHWFFTTKIYPEIRLSECGKCKDLCHIDPKDRGGLTCVGIAFNHNKNWYLNELNKFDKGCKPHFSGNFIQCKTKLLEIAAKELLYKKYAKPFETCPKKAFQLVVDSSVLEGVKTAKRHLKNAGGCEKFSGKAFTESRIKRFKSLKQCPRYCKGWIARAKRKLRIYENNL